MESKKRINMSIEESILADNLAKEKNSIGTDRNEANQKKSITLNVENAVAKNSPSEEVEGSTNSLCKGDRPSKNTVLAQSQTDDQAIKNNASTYSQSPIRKHKSPGRSTEKLRSSSRKRIRSKSKSPAHRSEAYTNLETNKSEKWTEFAKVHEDEDSKAGKKPGNLNLRDCQNDMSLKKRETSKENDIFDERMMPDKPFSRSLIGIRSSLTPGELETVRRIPSDTFAACQAAFLHSAPEQPENEGTVLLPLQAEASFDDDWMDSVTSIIKPGPASCLLSETIEERVASASGLSAHCGSLCRLLPQDTCEAAANREERRPLRRQPRSPSTGSSSGGGSSASDCESAGSASSGGGGGGRARSSRRRPLDRPPTPVGVPLSQRMMSARARRSALLRGAVAESSEEL